MFPTYFRYFLYRFVCLFFAHFKNLYLIWSSHHYHCVGCKCWAILGSHGHWSWGFFSVPYLLKHGTSINRVSFEDWWHSHLLPSVRHWIRSVVTVDRIRISRIWGWRSSNWVTAAGYFMVIGSTKIIQAQQNSIIVDVVFVHSGELPSYRSTDL